MIESSLRSLFILLGYLLCLTAPATAGDLAAIEREMVAEVNLARTQPARYADLLAETRREYDGLIRRRPGRAALQTTEGLRAVDEAIAYLRKVSPQAPVTASAGLSRAARDHAEDQARTGGIGHLGSDGSTPDQRASRHGRWQRRVGENIAYNDGNARDLVMQLIVDDGVPDRGHRHNLFAGDYQRIGVGCAPHPRFRQSCSMTLAAGFIESYPGRADERGAEASDTSVSGGDAWRLDDLLQAIARRLRGG